MNIAIIAAIVALTNLSVSAEMPFAILRSYGSYAKNQRYMERVFAAQERHPWLIEEIWFAGSGSAYATPSEKGKAAVEQNLPAREFCRDHGIRFSYQQGFTLGHGPDDVARPGIPEDAWIVNPDGRVRYGQFCCTSPFVKDFSRETAKAIMAALRPVTYWPDDDLRMNKARFQVTACFCERCVRLFGERMGRKFTRESLVAALMGPSPSADVRREWCRFNGEMLGEYAKVYREAADAASPETLVCQQGFYAADSVNGDGFRHILTAYDGNGMGTATRPGCEHYSDQEPYGVFAKLLCVGKDAANAAKLPCVRQICYEAENWPHIGALKSPGGLMAECSGAIAFGCDSLALYWGADVNCESLESYDFFFDTLSEWKPFLKAMRDGFRGTLPGGVAYYAGEGRFATDHWLRTMDLAHTSALIRNGLPVADQEAYPDAYDLNEDAVAALLRDDLPRVFAKPVLMDVAAFLVLSRRFPDLAAVKKVEVSDPRGAGSERFGAYGMCEGVKGVVRPLVKDVIAFSELTGVPTACGTCIIPTEFGGAIVLVQDTAFQAPAWASPQKSWTGCRRHGILDALDRAVPGGMPVRLMTDGYAVAVVARKTSDGRTRGAWVMNFGTGDTPPLELRIRRGVATNWKILRPRQAALSAAGAEGESVLRLPPLPAFGVLAVVPEER